MHIIYVIIFHPVKRFPAHLLGLCSVW